MSRPPLPESLASPAVPASTETTRPQPASAAPAPALWAGLLESLPLLVPALFAGFSLVAMVLLQLDAYRPALVLPLGVVAALLAARGVGLARPEPIEGPRWLDGLAVLAALIYAAFNARYAAQNIDVFRDPAVYAITGQWLVHNGSLPVPVHPEVFGAVKGLSFFSAGFDPGSTPGYVHPQFGNLLPGLLAVGGWIGGEGLLLRINPLIAGAALLAFYGLARQYAGRFWALVAVTALGVSLPMLHFSRNSYSEPVTLLFLVGGLALLREAQRRGRLAGYALAGLVLGAAVLARIDGFFFLLAVPMVAAVLLATASPESRRRTAAQIGVFLAGVAVPAVVAMANLVKLSPDYLHNLSPELGMIAKAAIGVTVLGAIGVLLTWRTALPRRIAAGTARWLPAAGAVAIVALAALAASRPLWYVGRTPGAPESQTHYITFLQQANKLPLDGTRSYAEQTMDWFWWYFGPVTVIGGVLGVAAGVRWLLRRGDLLVVAPLAMFLPAALLYITVPSIVPDQVWAMRRYLPVVIPGLLLATAFLLAVLARRSRAGLAVALALACVMVLFPTYVSARVATVRDGVPQLVEVDNLCDDLGQNAGQNAALLLTGALANSYQQTARSYCDPVPVAGIAKPTLEQLDRVRAAASAHGRRLYVAVSDRATLPAEAIAASTQWPPISCVRVEHLNATLNRAAYADGADKRTILLGLVGQGGTVTPAPPADPPLLAC
jgi:Dolichyl-phosphate-mannose-protein mannosyltransferase